MISWYAGLVRSCVRPYRASPEPVEDLMQVGYVGLLKAIRNFEPACGDSLHAYALPCISSEIKRGLRTASPPSTMWSVPSVPGRNGRPALITIWATRVHGCLSARLVG
ncbi:MAG: sigma factor [Streptosporangiaceae bacterium]